METPELRGGMIHRTATKNQEKQEVKFREQVGPRGRPALVSRKLERSRTRGREQEEQETVIK